jgi:hypothetical protein
VRERDARDVRGSSILGSSDMMNIRRIRLGSVGRRINEDAHVEKACPRALWMTIEQSSKFLPGDKCLHHNIISGGRPSHRLTALRQFDRFLQDLEGQTYDCSQLYCNTSEVTLIYLRGDSLVLFTAGFIIIHPSKESRHLSGRCTT